jgi:hypothetical protein
MSFCLLLFDYVPCSPPEVTAKKGKNMGQFHQHFWHKSRAAFVQIIFNAFNANNIWQKCAKIWCSEQMLKPKTCSKISAEMLVKEKSIFCIIYFKLVSILTKTFCAGKFNQRTQDIYHLISSSIKCVCPNTNSIFARPSPVVHEVLYFYDLFYRAY